MAKLIFIVMQQANKVNIKERIISRRKGIFLMNKTSQWNDNRPIKS